MAIYNPVGRGIKPLSVDAGRIVSMLLDILKHGLVTTLGMDSRFKKFDLLQTSYRTQGENTSVR